ncbi:ABC transporter substrate-binding protein [Dehalococcoidia bacterium]|nr:ABC transporter substrate-binding protein [Dehalococcoidia bacterium]
MSRQVKVMLAVVVMLVVLMPVLVACPPVVEEVPTIRIGIIGPMKFTVGEHTWWGAQMAADEINAAGGVNVGGVMHQIELFKADSNELLSVVDAVSAMERLITVDEVDFVIGGARTEAVLAKQEVMADHGVIFINVGSAHPEQCMRLAADYERYRYFFRGAAVVNSRYLGKMIFALVDMVAGEIRQELGIETPRVAIMMEKAVWTDPIVAAAKELLPQLGMEVVGVWRPSPIAADVTAELTAIKDAGAHIIMPAYLGPVGVTASRQWGELEIPAAKVGINTDAQSKRHWEATGGKVEWELTFNFIGPVEITPKTIPFYTRFLERFGDFPYYSAGVYDSIYLLKEAIERAGTLETYAVIDELKKTDFLGVGGRVVFTGIDSPYPHDLVWGPGYITGLGIQWRDGELVVVWPDGRAVLGDKAWEGIRFEGTVDYKLPPWMVEFWKGRQ